ncbi:radical SAM protein [Butyrivibrio sp. AE3004]|uniref:radical SAM protein n=1 Tax=Butyrivibrio sp. AE3004 TaxID=1506994 RepID=UPI00068FEB59|nr:radical SAM protein [Butyrivibrio sp. AE3004]
MIKEIYSSNAEKLFRKCAICPRKCNVNRMDGEMGYCGQTAHLTAARAYLHAWEEPCISGDNGSGTVFFSGCNMRCVFCQNESIASGKIAKKITPERLAEIFLELREQKASNINLVTPTHFVPIIILALEKAHDQGLDIPVVYNTSAYENVDTLKMLEGLVDIYLPDCKYYSDTLAIRYSNAPMYFDIAMDAIEEMLRQVGEPEFAKACGNGHNKRINAVQYNALMEESDDDYTGPLMTRGVIVRHLMLPGQLQDSKAVISKLIERFGNKIYISIMNQFTPCGNLESYPELLSGIKASEYDKLLDYSIDCGIENGFFQGEGTDSESFIPAFDYRGL